MWNTTLPILASIPFMENYRLLPTLSVGAASAGVLSHILYFIHGEHHKEALFLFTLFLLLPPASCLILTRFLQLSLSHVVQLTTTFITSYLGALWTSMIIYRSFFHRLHSFPGPPLARTSKLYHCLKLGKMDNFRKLAGWHGEYGDFVRIGMHPLAIPFSDLCMLNATEMAYVHVACAGNSILIHTTLYPPCIRQPSDRIFHKRNFLISSKVFFLRPLTSTD